VYITALILFLIITPLREGAYAQFLLLASFVCVIANTSKYILAIGKKHIFNPAAIALVLASFIIGQSASWWVATLEMLPLIIIGGILITRKLRHGDLVLSFFVSSLILITLAVFLKNGDVLNTLFTTIIYSPLFFFGFIMLTEPLTSPPTKKLRIIYGIIVGLLFTPFWNLGPISSSPELALVLGNIFSFIVSPKEKLILKLKEKTKVANDTYDFIFENHKKDTEKLSFRPGEYMEWTLSHEKPDTRGNRRYFTIASSPTENDIHLGIKFYGKPSSFKKHLLAMPIGQEVIGSSRAGDFILPKENQKGLVFIAGGIGVTPFRSMIKYLLDNNEKRDIIMFYSNKTVEDIAYREIFDEAENKLGIKTIYAITDTKDGLGGRNMYGGFINADLLKKELPNYAEKIFYISGPHGMVNVFEKTLKEMGVENKNIKIDFFPGYA